MFKYNKKSSKKLLQKFGSERYYHSKKCRTTIKPLFSSKIRSTEYITLEETGKIISNGKELVGIFNELL